MHLNDLIGDYLAFQSAKGDSPHTRRSYNAHLRHYARWWQARHKEPPTLSAFSETDLIVYMAGEERRGIRPRTRYLKVSAFRAFGKWLVTFDHLPENPAARVPLPRLDDPHRELITYEEASALLSACDRFPLRARGLLAKAVLLTFFTTGVRKSELLDLNLDDVDLSERHLTVRRGKGGKSRRLPIHPVTVEALAAWLSVRSKRAATSRLFLGARSSALSSYGLRHLLLDTQTIAGFRGKTNQSPHSLRYFFTDQLVEKMVDIKTIQELLGHKSVSTTWLYVRTNEARKRHAIDLLAVPGQSAPSNGSGTAHQENRHQSLQEAAPVRKRRRIALRPL